MRSAIASWLKRQTTPYSAQTKPKAILFANSATSKIFGYDSTELIGKPLTMLMPEFIRKVHETGFRRYLDTGVRHELAMHRAYRAAQEWKGVSGGDLIGRTDPK